LISTDSSFDSLDCYLIDEKTVALASEALVAFAEAFDARLNGHHIAETSANLRLEIAKRQTNQLP
jgi:hypothetical protein